jgi:hypothetical protein
MTSFTCGVRVKIRNRLLGCVESMMLLPILSVQKPGICEVAPCKEYSEGV